MDYKQEFKNFIQLLDKHEVPYLVIGGLAVAIYGYRRPTNDIDVFVSSQEEHVNRLNNAIPDFGFGDSGKSVEDFQKNQLIIRLEIPPKTIDLVNHMDGLKFEEAWPEKTTSMVDGIRMNFIGKDHLIQNKKAAGRPRDLEDLAGLKAI